MEISHTPAPAGKLVIRNIGLLLSGDLGNPVLDADTIVAVDGRIAAFGRAKNLDTDRATTIVDAKGIAVAPGLIDSHVHPVAGDWTPRQFQIDREEFKASVAAKPLNHIPGCWAEKKGWK